MFKKISFLAAVLIVSGCVTTTTTTVPKQPTIQRAAVKAPTINRTTSLNQFRSVLNRVEPVAERLCRARTRNTNCDLKIIIDERPSRYPNAYQTVDRNGRPILAFNRALLSAVRNDDELAFVAAHEAAHHIRNHLARQRENAIAGAIVFAGLTSLSGGSTQAVQQAQEIGAQIGARSYSKEFELEADELGTIIAIRAGFDPIKGSEFFFRIPDPGDRFLGTHPPNAARRALVLETARRQ